MRKSDLRVIGYWHSFLEPDFPDPAWFVDNTWDQSIKEAVLLHLRSGIRIPVIHMGSSWCRFRCGKDILGNKEFTDGKFVWPEGLEHYIEHHNIRLPQEIVDLMLSTNELPNVEFIDDRFLNIGFDWWKNQKGWNRLEKSFRDLQDIGLLTITQIDEGKKERQFILLKDFLFEAEDIPQRLKQIKNIIAGETTILKGRFIGYDIFKVKAIEEGLQTTFSEMTYADYQK